MNINKTAIERSNRAGVSEIKFIGVTAVETNHITSYKLDICFKIIDYDIRKGRD